MPGVRPPQQRASAQCVTCGVGTACHMCAVEWSGDATRDAEGGRSRPWASAGARATELWGAVGTQNTVCPWGDVLAKPMGKLLLVRAWRKEVPMRGRLRI